ncbi:MAG TPA: DUF983 domain-containing protein [Xanthobacteraceae bacterium]|nr:DUF983 domain-containing protein [Xanthobacteraceae bacterium]
MSEVRERRNLGQAVKRGILGRCPNCGQGRLFGKFLKVVDECAVCHETLKHHRADDAPAYVVILIVGHIIVPLALLVEKLYQPPHWLAFWLPLTLVMSLVLLQPVKGMIVAWQWSQHMHGFDPNHVDEIEMMKEPR